MEEEKELSDINDNSDDYVAPKIVEKVETKDHPVYNEATNEDSAEDEEDLLDKCPPDFELAKKHRDANRVKNFDARNTANKDLNDDKMYCPCCRLPTSMAAPPFSVCAKYTVLEDLGAGFPLYYQLKIFTLVIFIIMFLIVGIACTSINASKDKGNEWNDGEDPSFVVDMSIGNFGKDSDRYKSGSIVTQEILNIIMIVIIIIGSIMLRRFQKKVANNIDEQNITPSDYGVMVTHLPLNKTQEEVEQWLKGFINDLDIVYINYCYDVKDIVKAVRKLTDLNSTKAYLMAYKNKVLRKAGMTEQEAEANDLDTHPPPITSCCGAKKQYETIELIEEKIKEAEEVVEKLKIEMDVNTEKDLFCGTAFVVFNTQTQAQRLIKYFHVSPVKQMLNFIIYRLFKCTSAKVDERYYEGNHVIVERAAEPSDVYWENLSVSTFVRVKKQLKTNGLAFLCLCVAFGVNLGLSIAKDELDKSSEGESSSAAGFIRFISIITSFFVVSINVVLGRIIRILSAYEQHETYSKYHISVAVKLTIATFINTGIVPILVNFGKDNWFDRGGLMVDIFWNTTSVAFISPLFYLFNPVYIVKLIKICQEERKGEESKLTQRQANQLYEGPPLDMAQRYANTMLLFSLTLFYTFPLPVMPLLAIGGTVVQYWIEKWVLLKRHKIPEQMGATMAEVFSNMIPFLCFLYAISIFVFSQELSKGQSVGGLVALIGVIIYLVLPVRMIINKLTKDVDRQDNIFYKDRSLQFLTDYDRANPMSQKEANIKFIQRMREAGRLDIEQAQKQMQLYQQAGRFGGVMQYGQNSYGMQYRVASTYQQPFAMGARPVYMMPRPDQFNAYSMRGYGGAVPMSMRPIYGYSPAYQGVAMPQRMMYQPRMVARPQQVAPIQQPQYVSRPVMGYQQQPQYVQYSQGSYPVQAQATSGTVSYGARPVYQVAGQTQFYQAQAPPKTPTQH